MHTRFFCVGPPKSGTTLLQRCLNHHPSVVCPAEHSTDIVMHGLNELFTSYNRSLKLIDRRTGGYGATLVNSRTAARIFRAAVYELIDQDVHSHKAAGINDNSLAERLKFFHSLFDDAKWLIIVRHPIPRAISAWHHNQRLAAEEQDPAHLDLLTSAGSYEGWIKQLTLEWNRWITTFHPLIQSSPRIEIIRFEDLVENKERELKKVFQFLNVESDDSIVASIAEQTSFQAMRNAARKPGFLRQASLSPFDASLEREFVNELLHNAREGLRLIGYDPLST